MEHLHRSFGSSRVNPKYSDLIIRCDGYSYHVHRATVCSRSEVFARECDGAFKEKYTGVIEHTAFDALTLGRLLQFIYSDDYSLAALPTQIEDEYPDGALRDMQVMIQHFDDCHISEGTEAQGTVPMASGSGSLPPLMEILPASAHALVHALAGFYAVPDLQSLSLAKFADAMATLDLENMAEVAETVWAVTSTKDDKLREMALQIALRHAKELIGNDTFMTALLRAPDLSDFAADFLPAAVRQSLIASDQVKGLEAVLVVQEGTLTTKQAALKAAKAEALDANGRADKHMNELLKVRGSLVESQVSLSQRTTQHDKTLIQLDNAKAQIKDQQTRETLATDRHLAELLTLRRSLEAEQKRFELYQDKIEKYKTAVNEQNVRQNERIRETSAQLETQKTKLGADLAKAEQGSRDATAAAGHYSSLAERRLQTMKGIIRVSARQSSCRHCGDSFDSTVEWDNTAGPFAGLMLRCDGCTTRHWG